MYILQNEKYVGEMRLQKTFVADHLTKRKLRNKGERPDYYVTESHEPIIDRDVFDRVQQLIAERRRKYNPAPATPPRYPLTGLIECGLCGAHYQRKRKSFADGKVTLSYGSFLGYEKGEDGQPVIVEEEADVVRDIPPIHGPPTVRGRFSLSMRR